MEPSEKEKILLPHHVQKPLCTTRLPYRQGRKLTAVKVYTVNNESRHLLIFGVPSLSLRQEAKSLFLKFGKITQFTLSPEHEAEAFTETYHAVYEKIQAARLAKRMLDTKNFYGGCLHICYAPEMENIDDTREKLNQRKRDVLYRLRNLDKEKAEISSHEVIEEAVGMRENLVVKLNMGEVNTIGIGKQIRDVLFKTSFKRKSNLNSVCIQKQFKPCFVENKKVEEQMNDKDLEVIDFTSTEKQEITNINIDNTLNYNCFGKEVVKKIPSKPMNVIKFNLGSKKS